MGQIQKKAEINIELLFILKLYNRLTKCDSILKYASLMTMLLPDSE